MADPLFGATWNLARGMTTFSTNFAPADESREYEEIPNGYKLTVRGTHAGQPYSWGYTALYDGKDHPVHGRADVDAIEAYRVNDRVTVGFFKKNGVFGGAYNRGISLDGSTLTVLASGRNAAGQPYFDVITYKK